MRVGVVLLSFGEPTDPTPAAVEAYVERIFRQNLRLDDAGGDEEARIRELAARRAPGLIEAYLSIGGSPLNAQADAHAACVADVLGARRWDARVYSAFQFTRPFAAEAVARARDDGVETLVGLPVYPLCGPSTTVAALEDVRRALDEMDWHPRFVGIAGWHHHPGYVSLRTDHVRDFLAERALDLADPETLLCFSAHGTPLKYLSEGNRYDRYVDEHCRALAAGLRAPRYEVGFQNHENRPIPWTRPSTEEVVRRTDARRLVVVPVSFMHEQSETLVELDHDLRELVEGMGKELWRVPVPLDDPRFPPFLADLVAEAIAGNHERRGSLSACRCRAVADTWCTNGLRELPPSRYGGAEAR